MVAEEVRTLASRTQQSTQAIQDMIESLQAEAREAVSVMNAGQEKVTLSVDEASEAAGSLDQITHAVSDISDVSTQIASAAEEQSVVAAEISRNIQSINEAADQTTDDAARNASAAERLSGITRSLSTTICQFNH